MKAKNKLKTLTNYLQAVGYDVQKVSTNVYYLPFTTHLIFTRLDDIVIKSNNFNSNYEFVFRSSTIKIFLKMIEYDMIQIRPKQKTDPYYFRTRSRYRLGIHVPFYLLDVDNGKVRLLKNKIIVEYTQQSFYRLFTQNPKYKIHNNLN